MLKYLLIILLLVGCATETKIAPQIVKPAEFHPTWPLPYEVCNVQWKIVLDDKGWPIIGIPYPENLDLKACNKDKLRYIQEMKNILCYYRPETDPMCNEPKEP